MEAKKKHGHGYHRTEIEHHPDGSHTVRHHSHTEDTPSKAYAVADLAGVHGGLDANLTPPADAMAAGAAPAAPAAAAPGAPAPMPGA